MITFVVNFRILSKCIVAGPYTNHVVKGMKEGVFEIEYYIVA